MQCGNMQERLCFPSVGSSLQVWGRNLPADGRGNFSWAEAQSTGGRHILGCRGFATHTPRKGVSMVLGQVGCFLGELHRRMCVPVCDAYLILVGKDVLFIVYCSHLLTT